MKLGVIGGGKMGRLVAALAEERGQEVARVLGKRDNAAGRAIAAGALAGAEVAIEFTEPDAAVANVLACVDAGIPVVVGTTGWYDRLGDVTRAVNEKGGALVWAPNFAAGVVVFAAIVDAAARLVGNTTFEAHQIETHHAAKKDAPSGTALALADAFRSASGRDLPTTSVRVGHVPGRHTIHLEGPFDVIRLEHEARDRRVFADGALVAAEWLIGRKGVFTMRDVLGVGGHGA